MKEYSKSTKIWATVILQIIAYVLVVINAVTMEFYLVSDMAFKISIAISFLLIATPTVIMLKKYGIKYRHLVYGIIVVFCCVMIYSPDGFYLIIYKGDWFFTKAESNWVYGILIAIQFYLVQLVVVVIGKGMIYAKAESKEVADAKKLQQKPPMRNAELKIDVTTLEEKHH